MYRIEKRFTFPMGHRLSKHCGRCYSPHGHNFTVLVGIKSETLDENDMVMDFSTLKEIVSKILDNFDHCLLLNKSDFDFGEKVKELGGNTRVLYCDYDPTAERLAEFLYSEILKSLPYSHSHTVYIDYVTVFENENSKATYSQF